MIPAAILKARKAYFQSAKNGRRRVNSEAIKNPIPNTI
jgi:hypothetical protein